MSDLSELIAAEQEAEEIEAWEACGRWRNGILVDACLSAGAEDCAFCPLSRARSASHPTEE